MISARFRAQLLTGPRAGARRPWSNGSSPCRRRIRGARAGGSQPIGRTARRGCRRGADRSPVARDHLAESRHAAPGPARGLLVAASAHHAPDRDDQPAATSSRGRQRRGSCARASTSSPTRSVARAADAPRAAKPPRRRAVPTAGQAFIHVLLAASMRGEIVRGPMRDGEHAVRRGLRLARRSARTDGAPAGVGEAGAAYLAGHGPADARILRGGRSCRCATRAPVSKPSGRSS